MSAPSTFTRLLAPESIAIVGLSEDPTKHGARVLANLRKLGFGGTIWGVHPRTPEIEGIGTYASVSGLPHPADLLVCAIPGRLMPATLREAQGCGFAIVFAGGFAETGPDGAALQADLVDAARASGVRLLGPNSGGVIAPGSNLAASFLTCLDRPAEQVRSGPVGLVTQSGGTGSYLHNIAAAAGSGFAASISTGNEADLGVADGIRALAAIDEVRVIALMLETVRDGDAFVGAVRAATDAGKRVVATRVGVSDQGQAMIQSHTGALASSVRVFEGVVDALDITLAETPAEMVDIAEVLARTPGPAGDRVGVVTHSGGIAILLSDLAAKHGVSLPQPSPQLKAHLEPLLQQGASNNPLDMGGIIGGPHRFGEVVGHFASEYDLVVAVSTAHPPAHTAARVDGMIATEYPVPVVHLWMAGDVGAHGLNALRAANRSVTEDPRVAMRASAALTRARTDRRGVQPIALDQTEALEPRPTEHAAKQYLAALGIPVPRGWIAADPAEALTHAETLGFPVVAKLSSGDLAHKTELGVVHLGLDSPAALEAAAREILEVAAEENLTTDGVLIEPMRPGIELIAGLVHDDVFGPQVLIGMGGIFAEALDDSVTAPAPVTTAHAARMIQRLRGLRALTSPRRGRPADLAALAELISRVSMLAAVPDIAELDLNPLAWTADGWLALDAVVRRHL
jgi:acyl-CoA synthetase (NDP forming)